MRDRLDVLTEKVVSGLDARFDAVDEHFVELREYVEFGYTRLEKRLDTLATKLELETGLTAVRTEMNAGFARLDRKLDRLIDARAPRDGGQSAQ